MDRALADKRVFVAGDRGMVGQALLQRLAGEECTLLTAPPTLDLRDQAATFGWLAEHRDDLVVMEKLRSCADVWVGSGREPAALIPVRRP